MPSTQTELTVTVKLFATLREHTPEGASPRGFPAVLSAGTTVGDLVAHIGLPEAKWKVAFINSVICRDLGRELEDGDVVAFFPPIAGG